MPDAIPVPEATGPHILPPPAGPLDPPEGSIACVVCGRFCKLGIGITAHMRKHNKTRRKKAAKASAAPRAKDVTPFDTKLAIEHTPAEVAFVLREMARKAEARAEKLRDLADELDAEAEIEKKAGGR